MFETRKAMSEIKDVYAGAGLLGEAAYSTIDVKLGDYSFQVNARGGVPLQDEVDKGLAGLGWISENEGLQASRIQGDDLHVFRWPTRYDQSRKVLFADKFHYEKYDIRTGEKETSLEAQCSKLSGEGQFLLGGILSVLGGHAVIAAQEAGHLIGSDWYGLLPMAAIPAAGVYQVADNYLGLKKMQRTADLVQEYNQADMKRATETISCFLKSTGELEKDIGKKLEELPNVSTFRRDLSDLKIEAAKVQADYVTNLRPYDDEGHVGTPVRVVNKTGKGIPLIRLV